MTQRDFYNAIVKADVAVSKAKPEGAKAKKTVYTLVVEQ